MDEFYNTGIKELKNKMLKITGIIAAATGIIAAFFGFYIMMINMQSFDKGMDKEALLIYKKMYLLGIYIIALGVVFCIFGFYGVVNSGVYDNCRNVVKYAVIMCVFSLVDIILAALFCNINAVSMGLVMVPMVISILFLIAARSNYKNVNDLFDKKVTEGE